MVSLNFQPRFVDQILAGDKCQTIRKTRRCKAGDAMHLFTGLRTADCKSLKIVTCILVDTVQLGPGGIIFGSKKKHPDKDHFAKWDGFEDYNEMYDWFLDNYEQEYFFGFVHRWL